MCDSDTSQRDRAKLAGIQLAERFPDLMPGALFFSCSRMQAHVTLDTCRKNWDEAHARRRPDDEDRRAACRSCEVGRLLHTESSPVGAKWADLRHSGECSRCGRRDLRIVAGVECVSCWNRRKESEKGRNARGTTIMFPITLTPRRVGLIIDGKPTYRRFLAIHDGEAISRAIRQVDGAGFHDQQPASSVWNPRAGRFQYRCSKHPGEFGTLRELVSDDGAIEHTCPVCTPGRAKGLPEARVEAATSLASPEWVTFIMSESPWVSEITEQWTPTPHVCDRCQHYPIQVRQRSRIEARCPLCDAHKQ